MKDIQPYFIKFHEKIKAEKNTLREKRDILASKIQESLKSMNHPTPDILNQGSFIYGVGVKPINDEEYDIDVGLIFPILLTDYEPAIVRGWVYDAVKNHTDDVEDRGSCIRVRYAEGFHVDLVCYAQHHNNETIDDYHFAHKSGKWIQADPKKLKEYIKSAREKFANTKDNCTSDQLQRITRYLKRWNDLCFKNDISNKPFGLAILLLTIKNLPFPQLDNDNKSHDLKALLLVLNSIQSIQGRISLNKPTPEYEDVFAKLDDLAMEKFKGHITELNNDLIEIFQEDNIDEINKLTKKNFGKDFPNIEEPSKQSHIIFNNKEDRLDDMNNALKTFNNPCRPYYTKV